MRLLLASRSIILASVTIAAVAATWAGCGGDSNSSGGGGSGGGSGGANQGGQTSTGGGNDQGGGNSTGGATSTGGGTSNGGGSATGGGNATGGGGGNGAGGSSDACPDASGYYAMIAKAGPLCGDLNTDAAACVMPAQEICAYQISSGSPNSQQPPSVNGTILLAQDGTFTGATIFEGSSTMPRTGCDGKFKNGVLTITCGGDPSDPMNTQWCQVKLTRTGNACPGMNP